MGDGIARAIACEPPCSLRAAASVASGCPIERAAVTGLKKQNPLEPLQSAPTGREVTACGRMCQLDCSSFFRRSGRFRIRRMSLSDRSRSLPLTSPILCSRQICRIRPVVNSSSLATSATVQTFVIVICMPPKLPYAVGLVQKKRSPDAEAAET